MAPTGPTVPVVRRAVRRMLEQSPAFTALPADAQTSVARDTVVVTTYLAGAAPPNVALPAFVAGLVHGVFNGVFDASVQQMDAYASLMKSVAKTVDTADDSDDARRTVRRKVTRGMATRRL